MNKLIKNNNDEYELNITQDSLLLNRYTVNIMENITLFDINRIIDTIKIFNPSYMVVNEKIANDDYYIYLNLCKSFAFKAYIFMSEILKDRPHSHGIHHAMSVCMNALTILASIINSSCVYSGNKIVNTNYDINTYIYLIKSVILCSLFHDLNDKKYEYVLINNNSNMEKFNKLICKWIKNNLNNDDMNSNCDQNDDNHNRFGDNIPNRLLLIIEYISYSKEMKIGKGNWRKLFNELEIIIYECVSDGDKLEALDANRCLEYTYETYETYNEYKTFIKSFLANENNVLTPTTIRKFCLKSTLEHIHYKLINLYPKSYFDNINKYVDNLEEYNKSLNEISNYIDEGFIYTKMGLKIGYPLYKDLLHSIEQYKLELEELT